MVAPAARQGFGRELSPTQCVPKPTEEIVVANQQPNELQARDKSQASAANVQNVVRATTGVVAAQVAAVTIATPREDLPPVDPTTVSAVATTFLEGLVKSAGLNGSVSAKVEGEHIDIDVLGDDLGFLVGTKGATLLALQDLTRVVSQRRLGDHETRLRVDVAGYREKRREALSRFALKVADDVKTSGQARALEPMNSSDRKIVHDALTEVDGISTRSEGSDPFRRVVVALASISEDSEIDDNADDSIGADSSTDE